jgi:hypothetical protein
VDSFWVGDQPSTIALLCNMGRRARRCANCRVIRSAAGSPKSVPLGLRKPLEWLPPTR